MPGGGTRRDENVVVTIRAGDVVTQRDGNDVGITEGDENDLPVLSERINMGVNSSNLSKAREGSNKAPVALASVFQLFRFATSLDVFCIILGAMASGVTGAAQPAMMVGKPLLSTSGGPIIPQLSTPGGFRKPPLSPHTSTTRRTAGPLRRSDLWRGLHVCWQPEQQHWRHH